MPPKKTVSKTGKPSKGKQKPEESGGGKEELDAGMGQTQTMLVHYYMTCQTKTMFVHLKQKLG